MKLPCTECDYYSDGPDPEASEHSVGCCCCRMAKAAAVPLSARAVQVGCERHSGRDKRNAAVEAIRDVLPVLIEYLQSTLVPPDDKPPFDGVDFEPPETKT